jgi:hypothetical protein
MVDRQTLLEIINDLEDADELLADLLDVVYEAIDTGDFTGVEDVLGCIEEICEVRDNLGVVASWKDFYGGEGAEEAEEPE